MNKQCEFHEFVAILRAALVEQANTPGFRFDALTITKERLDEGYGIDDYVTSDQFEKDLMKLYQNAVKNALMEKRWFKLIDALEETVNFWSYGRDVARAPLHGSYVPVRHTVMPKPNMKAADAELDYRYNLHKLGPTEHASPLKAYEMSPAFRPKDHSGLLMYRSQLKLIKDRRISRPKHNRFSTLDKQNFMPADTQVNNLSGGATLRQQSYLPSLFGGMDTGVSPHNPMH